MALLSFFTKTTSPFNRFSRFLGPRYPTGAILALCDAQGKESFLPSAQKLNKLLPIMNAATVVDECQKGERSTFRLRRISLRTVPVSQSQLCLKIQIRHFDPAKRDRLAGDVEDSGPPWAEKPCLSCLDDEFLGKAARFWRHSCIKLIAGSGSP
jgi:hypothetical protein